MPPLMTISRGRAKSSPPRSYAALPVPSLEEDLAARLASGEEVVLATVIRLDGEPPSRTGAKLLMSRSATLAGTLGSSEFDPPAPHHPARTPTGPPPHPL